MNTNYTPAELMVAAAAREIRDGDVVFVGMRLPLLAFQLAQATHAPRAVGVFEAGIVRGEPAPAPLVTMGDLPNLYGALWCTDSLNALGLLQRGLIDVGFIGGAQVDRYGNLNTTYVLNQPEPAPEPGNPLRARVVQERLRPGMSGLTRLPGSGGACDIASMAGRLVLIMAHERRRFVERVDYVTSPGYGTGQGWRARIGLTGGGPAAVITTMAVLRFSAEGREMVLASVHPGRTIEEVKARTGWALAVAEDVSETPPPTPKELALVRRWDPEGFWTQ